jgi:hypothetical protein
MRTLEVLAVDRDVVDQSALRSVAVVPVERDAVDQTPVRSLREVSP